MNGGGDQAERPRPQTGIEGDDMRTCAAAVVVLGAHAGEDVLRDVDLMFFTIDVSGGTHAARRCILGALGRVAA